VDEKGKARSGLVLSAAMLSRLGRGTG